MWTPKDFKNLQEQHPAPAPRGFARLMSAVFFIFGLLVYRINPFFIALGILFLLLSLIKPQWLSLPNRMWHQFGLALSWFITPVILIVVYYVVFTPMALIIKLFGHRALPHKGWVAKTKDCRFDKIF